MAKAKTAAKIPAGFTSVAVGEGFSAWHDFTKEKVLQGVVVDVGSFKHDGKDRRVIRVKKPDGVLASVSESMSLKELFDMKNLKGRQVYIELEGQETLDKTGDNGEPIKRNLYVVGVK